MGLFSKLFLSSAPVAVRNSNSEPGMQTVLVYLEEDSLPDEMYEQYDVATLSYNLNDLVEQHEIGEYEGEERGPGGTTLIFSSDDAERCFKGIESILRAYPLCANARVVVRQGGEGAPQREVRFQNR